MNTVNLLTTPLLLPLKGGADSNSLGGSAFSHDKNFESILLNEVVKAMNRTTSAITESVPAELPLSFNSSLFGELYTHVLSAYLVNQLSTQKGSQTR